MRALLVSEDETVYRDVAGERDEDLAALGISPPLLARVSGWATFPHGGLAHPSRRVCPTADARAEPAGPQPPPSLTPWQEAHAAAVIVKVPKVSSSALKATTHPHADALPADW